MSRLKKKLLIYFILISIVSISVSAEIILEVSSSSFQDSISANFYAQMKAHAPEHIISDLRKNIDHGKVYEPVYKFRNRMILFLIVVTGSIIGAFFMFTRDIVLPMDGLVEAAKKISGGDLTVTVPVMSEDEIGQLAGFVNEMNRNLQGLIFQVKQEVNRYKNKIEMAGNRLSYLHGSEMTGNIIEKKRMRLSDFKEMVGVGKELSGFLKIMSNDLASLETYIGMYKIYQFHSEISQDEIEEAMKHFSAGKGGQTAS